MPARGLHGMWLRGLAAAAACLLALASTGALVAAAVVTPPVSRPAIVLTAQTGPISNSGDEATTTAKDHHGHGNGGNSPVATTPVATIPVAKTPAPKPTKAPKPTDPATPDATAKVHPTAAPKPATAQQAQQQQAAEHAAHPSQPANAAPTAKVVMNSADPAPFAAQVVAAADATRVLPVEALGPLSGISFGSGLFIWPLLLAVDVLALASIARMALRRRLTPPED